MKNSIDTIGNLSRDLLAYSAVPQATAPQRATISCRCFSVLTAAILSKEDDRQNATHIHTHTHTAGHGEKTGDYGYNAARFSVCT